MNQYPDDKIIINKLKEGDVLSFDNIFKKYNKKVYYFALSYLKNKEEAEEVVQEIWDQNIADIQKAYELLPERYVEGMMHPSSQVRANKFAAAAMLARSYFAMGNYTEAKKYASFVIDQNGGDYDLTEEPIEAYNKSSLTRGKETILYIPSYDETNGKQNLYGTCFNHLFLENPCSWTATNMDCTELKRIGWMNNPISDTTINIAARRDKSFQQLMYVREPANVPESERIPGRYIELFLIYLT